MEPDEKANQYVERGPVIEFTSCCGTAVNDMRVCAGTSGHIHAGFRSIRVN